MTTKKIFNGEGEGGRGCGTGVERDSGEDKKYERQLACSGAGGLLS